MEEPKGCRRVRTKEVMKYLHATVPVLKKVKLQKVSNPAFSRELLRYERSLVCRHCKIGIAYCKDDQTTDDEMFSNGSFESYP